MIIRKTEICSQNLSGKWNFIEENGSSFAVRPEDVTLQHDQNGKYEIFHNKSEYHAIQLY